MAAPEQLESERLSRLFQNWKASAIALNGDVQSGDEIEKTNTNLQQEAKACFQTTPLNHEQAIARLIQDLGPLFTSESLPVRFSGLSILLGTVEGCCDKAISNSSLDLLGNFLVLQCGPIVDDEYEEDYDSMIRDISIKCLTALVETASPNYEDQNYQEYVKAFGFRLSYAKKGVECRCATPDDEMSMNDHVIAENDIRGGLSTMPRSKRSLCFSLLYAAVMGSSKLTKLAQHQLKMTTEEQQSTFESAIQSQSVEFAEFTARCIHGESDPRCLLQLLKLLYFTQVNFRCWFPAANTSSPDNVFPHEDFFDAVAPYYPIQFTPPPNNIHGITREGLHSSLVSVLTFTRMDEGARKYRRPTMLGCSFSLFLEQVLPGQPEEDSPTTLEKLEGLECITNLIFPSSTESECRNLNFGELRNLSSALITLHDEASVGATHDSGDLRDQKRRLAETCRSLASRIAMDLEKSNSSSAEKLWEIFVLETLEKEIKKLKLTPAYAKTSIAYEASLAASGGPRTLRSCLAKGLGPLLEYLRAHIDDSSDNTLAAIHGVAAFVSSCQVTLSKSRAELGVELTPHPLEAFAKDISILLFQIVEDKGSSCSFLHKAAAASCLECLLLSSNDKDLGSEEIVERICNFLKSLLDTVGAPMQQEPIADQEGFSKYRRIASGVLGRIIGASLTESDKDDEESNATKSRSVLLSQPIQGYVRSQIFPQIMATSIENTDNDGDRFDRIALSATCSSSPSLASDIVSAHLEALISALKASITSQTSRTCLEALSSILRSCVGDNAIRAFHQSGLVDKIFEILCYNLITSASSEEKDLNNSISQIELKASIVNGDEESMELKINAVNVICRGLKPAFTRLVPPSRLKKLLKTISDKIPPLSEGDEGILIVVLPILSAAPQAADPLLLEQVVDEVNCDEGLPVTELLGGLTEYVLSEEHLASVRNAGALCVYALLKSGFNRNLGCPAKTLLDDINRRILASSNDLRSTTNCLNYLSLLSSAAALRGTSSLSTADGIARFLTALACEGRAELKLCSQVENKWIIFSALTEEEYSETTLRIIAASAYGAIMMEEGMKPLMKQRLTHICTNYIKKLCEKEQGNIPKSGDQIGRLMITCHLICASDLSKFDRSIIHLLATLVMKGFSTDVFRSSSQIATNFPAETAKARTLIVSTILKLLCIVPQALNGLVLEMVSGLLRAYAVSDPSSDVGCKLITLQALEALTRLDGAKDSIAAVKPAVIAILSSAMSQKNVLLRSAAVDVRNIWCLAT